MAYTPTYINASQFSVPGDVLAELRIGTVLYIDQGIPYLDHITVAIYDAGSNTTRITVETGTLTDDMTAVKKGPTFVDDAAQESNLSKHDHSAAWQGSYQAFSKLTNDDIVDNLISVGGVSIAVANFILGVNAAGTALEKKELKGTADQITVDDSVANEITLSLPQDVATSSSPQFAGMTLTTAEGVLVAASSGEVSSVLLQNGEVARHNGSAIEAVSMTVRNCKDVSSGTWVDGQTIVWSGTRFVNGFPHTSGGGGDASSTLAMMNILGGGGSVSAEDFEVNVLDLIDGGATPIDADKLEIDYDPVYSIPVAAVQTDAADQLTSILRGLDNNFGAPHPSTYCPLPLKVTGGTGTNNLTIQAGDYWLYGGRWNGSYQNFQYRKATYEADVADSFWNTISTSNSIADSWYAVFVRSGISGGTVSLESIPLFRVNAAAYNDPWTELTPGTHDDHTVENTDFIASNDQWNGRKLVRISRDKTSGTVYTIVDTDETNNLITLGGDETDAIVAGDWFFILPVEATYYYCYVGMVRTAATDNYLVELERTQGSWTYFYQDTYPVVSGNLHGSTPADTSIAALLPPTAKAACIQVEVSPSSSVTDLGVTSFRNSSDANGVDRYLDFGVGAQQSAVFDFNIELYSPCIYRHYIYQETDPADAGTVKVLSFNE